MCKRGTIFYKSYMKGLPFLLEKVYKEGKVLDLRAAPPGIKLC